MNKRKYLRFNEEKPQIINLKFEHPTLKSKGFMPAIVMDQNHTSIACVFCYHDFDNTITELEWKESEKITTPCKVIRIDYLDTAVYKIIFTFA